MAVNENDPLHTGHQPGQQPGQQSIGYKPTASLDHDGEQNAYGQDHDATNHNRDMQYVNAAHQPGQAPPDFKAQGREGQHPAGNPNDPPRTGNQEPDPRRQDDDDDTDGSGQEIIPEVPPRREEREKQAPKANPGDPEQLDRSGTDKNEQFPIDDSSRFSE